MAQNPRNAFAGDNYLKPAGVMDKKEYVSWVGNPFFTDRTKQYIRDAYVGRVPFADKNGFSQKVPYTRMRVGFVYYRKMHRDEYNNIARDGVMGAAIKRINTNNYRVWYSSSLGMVRSFYNENAERDANTIVKITFDVDPLKTFSCKPHQEPGVQHDPNVMAVHRESFANIGEFRTKDFDEVKTKNLDHNIGVCEAMREAVEGHVTAWAEV